MIADIFTSVWIVGLAFGYSTLVALYIFEAICYDRLHDLQPASVVRIHIASAMPWPQRLTATDLADAYTPIAYRHVEVDWASVDEHLRRERRALAWATDTFEQIRAEVYAV